MHSKTMRNKQRYCRQQQNHVRIQRFRRRNGKNCQARKTHVYVFEGHEKNCVERCCELANQTTQQLYKVSTPCLDDHQVKEEEKGSVGEMSKVCSQIVKKCLCLAYIGRPDVLWSNLHEQSKNRPEHVTNASLV